MSGIPADRREFRCEHCGGRILIPLDLPPTTGPCPHCRETITSPAPERVVAAGEVPMVPVVPAPPPPATLPDPAAAVEDSPSSGGMSGGEAGPESRRPARKAPLENARRVVADPPLEPPAPSRSGVIGALAVAAVLVAGAAGMAFWLAKQQGSNRTGEKTGPDTAAEEAERQREVDESRYIRVGWLADAQQVLGDFIAARTPAEKAKHVLGGEKLLGAMEEFYGGGMIDDRDTPAETFCAYDLAEEDRRRGIFLMTYDLPPQFELGTFFRPLAPLKVQLGVEEPDLLLSTFARVANFSSEPVRVHAFFKRTPDGLKLDWETFVQTKYRTFRSFIEAPEAGRAQVFRVILLEDVPEAGVGSRGARTYRLVDPVNFSDSTRVEVPVDTEIGRILSAVNWRGAGGVKAVPKTATVELAWEGGDSPRLRIQRILCWEFLGLGGVEGNTEPNGGR